MRAFTSFGDGHGVWEKDGGTLLPFYARNMRDVTQWAAPLSSDRSSCRRCSELQSTATSARRRTAPASTAAPRRDGRQGPVARPRPRRRRCSRRSTGLVWAAVRDGRARSRTRRDSEPDGSRARASIVQVTNLGITRQGQPAEHARVRDPPRHRRAGPGAAVSIVRARQQRCSGAARPAPTAWPSRPTRACATATTGGSSRSSSPPRRTATSPTSAATGTKASRPWDFGIGASTCDEASRCCAAAVFTDRGVYKARRRGAPQGDPAAQHADRHAPAARRHAA